MHRVRTQSHNVSVNRYERLEPVLFTTLAIVLVALISRNEINCESITTFIPFYFYNTLPTRY